MFVASLAKPSPVNPLYQQSCNLSELRTESSIDAAFWQQVDNCITKWHNGYIHWQMMKIHQSKITFQNIAANCHDTSRKIITTIDELNELMLDFSKRYPGFVELEFFKGSRLQVGLGGPFACVQFIRNGNMPPYLCAKTKKIGAKHEIEFLCGGTPTPVQPEFCLAFDEAVTIAEYFFQKGERNPNFTWMEV